MTGDPEQEYISDGITENIITALSKISEMFVIARNSTFIYKAKPVKIKQVSEELGVRYVLEGSVQKEDDRIRITAQLIDATTGHHLWSERYDRDLKSLFALLDEITKEIVTALDVKLTHGEQARIWHRGTDNFEAWEYAVRGVSLYWRFTKGNIAKARELFKKAVDLDPMYTWAWTMLAWTHLVDARMGFSQSPVESFKRGDELAQKALALNDSDPDVNAQLGRIYLSKRQYDKAIATGKKAITLGPSNAYAHFLLGQTMFFAGKGEEAIPLFQKAMRLHGPYGSAYPLLFLGISYHMLGRNEEALPVFKKLLDRSRKGELPEFIVHMNLAAVNIGLGREEEAHKHASEVLRLNPKFSLKWIRKVDYFKDPAHLEQRLEPLRKAGLPE
jgi:adenylate cyclase